MIQRSVINKATKIRMLKFSNSFFSKLVQWWIEDYSTEATTSILFDDRNSIIIDQINKDIKEYNGVKFSLGLSLQYFKDAKRW